MQRRLSTPQPATAAEPPAAKGREPSAAEPMYISFRSHSFSISAPYRAGHQLSEAEAQALNQLRAENIRNTLGKRLASRELTPEVLTETIAWLAQYDAAYQFRLRASKADTPAAPWSVEAEALAIARDMTEKSWRQDFRLPVESPEEFGAEVQALAGSPAILAAAIAKIEAKKEIARKALNELLGRDDDDGDSQ